VIVRSWPLWRLPRWLAVFMTVVVAIYVLALAGGLALMPFRIHDLQLFAVLLLFGVVSIELTRHEGEATEYTKDVHGVWHLPVAILLPPIYSMLAPILKMLLFQLRVTHKPLHRRVFTAAAVGLSYGAASLAFHAVAPRLPALAAGPEAHWLSWAATACACAFLQSALNAALIAIALRGIDPSVSLRERQFARDPLYNDLAEQVAGTLLAVLLAATGAMLLAGLALPLVTLLQRSMRHAQLTDAARLDPKTGLLNAVTWQREARAELGRAERQRTPVSLAMIDIDHFKRINDVYGHLVGDGVLIALARLLREELRQHDLTGRFGGEEFAVVFPYTGAADAAQIAERLRATIAKTTFDTFGGDQIKVTISIGLTTMAPGQGTGLEDLLVTADAALYRAKAAGRNQVRGFPG
jgi:diguanylate cyclase (GGDEF)-like protein